MGITAVSMFFIFAFFHPLHPFLLTPEGEAFYRKNCPKFKCGKLGDIDFPYTDHTRPDCGPFMVDGCDKEIQSIQFVQGEPKFYQVESISMANVISVVDKEFHKQLDSNSCEAFNNLSLPTLPYASFQIMSNLTLLKCKRPVDVASHLANFEFKDSENFSIYYTYQNKSVLNERPHCSAVQLPVNATEGYVDIFKLLTAKFSLNITLDFCDGCVLGGKCVYDNRGFRYCDGSKSRPEPPPRSTGEGNNTDLKRNNQSGTNLPIVAIAASAIAVGIGVSWVTIFCFKKKFTSNKCKDNQSIEAFLRNHGSLAPKRYRYSEVKKMMNAFKVKLGQGGYGSVFKGKLPDGRLVAVKVLKDSKSNGEEFINEVASISRTSHVNIVTLLGFCFKGSKRALIYEFMSNGSLDKYIYEENCQLGWEILHQIAVGIARGLEYLHRGCNTRILHFDIKPHNILLDDNFFPKISDFGLAKICLGRESTISIIDARGTAGYIAPEVFCRNIGAISHKSDVYSYGMLVLEIVGGRKNICVEVDHSSEIYFPHWIWKRLELGEELGLSEIDKKQENQLVRKMIIVSLWCIQTDPSNRPPMSRVVEMLQGSIESLPIPPRPYLCSP